MAGRLQKIGEFYYLLTYSNRSRCSFRRSAATDAAMSQRFLLFLSFLDCFPLSCITHTIQTDSRKEVKKKKKKITKHDLKLAAVYN